MSVPAAKNPPFPDLILMSSPTSINKSSPASRLISSEALINVSVLPATYKSLPSSYIQASPSSKPIPYDNTRLDQARLPPDPSLVEPFT